ncbi:YceI family protein [Reichenbachiella versicolor]|uniref:YceI family protein n=1 Tax=Reichenbachiella versicolor TaxID=1821036 RepID=UPI0013A57E5F|nr:YceI family protein [Reichenbachiella versicolor]
MRAVLLVFLLLGAFVADAQKYKSVSSKVHFFSEAPMENIEAVNSQSQSVFDAESGQIVFSIPVDQFQFDKKLMQEHFNENYMETEDYPTATFKAQLQDWKGLSSSQTATAKGGLDVHGITQNREIEGKISKTNDKVMVDAKFVIELKDHKIKIPKAVFYNIAEKIEVTVHFEYEPIK